ncbi:MAG: hypothetical protein SPF22_07610 [Candidatus Onthovivens sp.]|nr:hypothetical protein [Candidatus Onthovivens sp.]
MESSKYIDVESEYKQFVEDFVSFLKEQSEKYNKPTLSEKYDYLGNKFAISDFISNHNFFINFKLNKYQSFTMNKREVIDTLKSFIAKNMESLDPKPEEITPDIIPQILQRIGNSNKFIKINLKKAYELGLVELPFVKYSFDFEKVKEDLLGFLNPVNIFNSKNTFSVFILLNKFIMDSIIFIKINTVKENLSLLNDYYDQHGTYSINYKIAEDNIKEINQILDNYFKKLDTLRDKIETDDYLNSLDGIYSYLVTIISNEFSIDFENKDVYFKISPNHRLRNFKIYFNPDKKLDKDI